MEPTDSTHNRANLPRVLEPEFMDSPAEAQAYDAMDHGDVNRGFATDLRTAIDGAGLRATDSRLKILDLGTGTALIPIEICRQLPEARITAVDAAANMLDRARQNVAAAGLADRIKLCQADVKRPFPDGGPWQVVISNSLVHHIAEPATLLATADRATAPGGLQFFRDLVRPRKESELSRLVALHAAGATDEQQKMLADSLRAALTLAEVREMVERRGYDPATVEITSDRHWTWSAIKP
jgi:ubiquinone/menaquinone biosynthesis C-methylase UbiE